MKSLSWFYKLWRHHRQKKSYIYLESKAGERIDLATHWSFKACPLPVLVAVGECSVAEKYHSLSFLSKGSKNWKKESFSKPDWRSLHIQPGLRIFWEEGKIQENQNKSVKIKNRNKNLMISTCRNRGEERRMERKRLTIERKVAWD